MSRTGLVVVLAIAVAVGLVFGLFPRLDLKIAALFYDPAQRGFPLSLSPLLRWMRDSSQVVIAALAAPAAVSLVVKLLLPRWRMAVSARASLFLIATLLLGPGLLANVILKDNWSRSRPIEVPEFGGVERFVPWWDPRGECPKNCSFVAGEGAGAFWTVAPAALAPLPWRPLAYAAAVAFGSVVGVLRMVFGGHFFTDVVFAGVLMFLVIWLTHGLLYRWSATHVSDAALERALAAPTLALHRLFARLFAPRGGPSSGGAGPHDG